MMALTANINRDSKARPEPFTAIDFMNFVDRPAEPEAPEQDPETLSARIATELFKLG